MKAVRIHAYGGPEQMQFDEASIPTCGANDVLVRAVAAGINPVDWKIRSTQKASWATLKLGGILVSTAMPPLPERAAAAGARAAFVFTPPRGAVLAQLAQRVDTGLLRLLVGQAFALADAAQAHRLGESGQARGKMILHVGVPQA